MKFLYKFYILVKRENQKTGLGRYGSYQSQLFCFWSIDRVIDSKIIRDKYLLGCWGLDNFCP
jgi:hypothetical protein